MSQFSIDYRDKKLDVDLILGFIPPDLADSLFQIFIDRIPWPQNNGRQRVNCIYGDEGLVYEVNFRNDLYRRQAIPWSKLPMLSELREIVENETGKKFNFCSIMLYPTGNVGILPHRDREMVSGTTICGLSLGSTRTLVFRPPSFIESNPIRLHLENGSLYSMNPPTNDYWSHEIEVNRGAGPRISLTFRNVRK